MKRFFNGKTLRGLNGDLVHRDQTRARLNDFNMKRIFSITLLLLTVMVVAGCSLAAPAPTAPITGPIAPAPTQSVSTEPVQLPTRRPDANAGAAIYADKCIACHGLQGRGDGTRAAQIQSQTGTPPADLTSDPIARAQSPEQWYNQITNGQLDKLMPPFAQSLTPDQRWDVIAYLWTLATSPSEIAQGQSIYISQCVQCHGATGRGDGPQAKGTLPDFTQFATFTSIAIGQWDQSLTSSHVPSFAGQLNGTDQRAVDNYIRSLAFENAANPSVSSTPNAPATSGVTPTVPVSGLVPSTIVEGYILNGTAGQSAPTNVPVTIYILHADNSVVSQTLQADAQGKFVANNLPATHGDTLYGEVVYKGLNFFNGPVAYGLDLTATLPITVYESTPDTTQVKIDTLHIVAVPNATGLQVSEIYVLSNLGDRFVAGFGQPIMHLSLPAGAASFSPDPNMPSDVLQLNGDGVDYYDAVPVGTGSAQIVFQYQLSGSSFVLDRPVFQNVGSVNLLVQGDVNQLQVVGSQFINQGAQPIQGTTYQQFSAQNLKPGDKISLTISGAGTPIDWRVLLGGGLIAVGIIGLTVWQVQRRRGSKPKMRTGVAQAEEDQDSLLDQIAALDDLHEVGQIDEASYTTKRAQLKKKLLNLMSDD
jgi:mono/diheme cytochrome c family protein